VADESLTRDSKSKKGKEVAKAKAPKTSVLIITDKKDEKVKYSTRNLVGVKQINFENINILDLLKYRNLVITKESVAKFEKQYK
jgi:large subunit ribosomal protein L4